ncbi:SHOCT domain-containing protein [Enterococcus avium]|uniref:SHOCT domain-containing protein n=1 Tax=Enterococcus avium TaxID=33945 RepID=UPI001C1138F4|nr:SHOCT domain-containing protein [Enterococcus avium]MBU5369591.1 SHOCT domain-containing protein [Enterococcus avium]
MGLFDTLKKVGSDMMKDTELTSKALKQGAFTEEELNFFAKKHNGQFPEEYRVEQERLKAEHLEQKRIDAENKRVDEVTNPKKYFKRTKSSKNIEIDQTHGLWRIKNALGTGSIYLFEELLSYDLSTNTGVQVKGGVSVGRAIVGGALLGPAGMILGGATGKKKQINKISRIEININVNGAARSSRNISIYKGKDIEENSSLAGTYFKTAQADLAMLDLVSQSSAPSRTINELSDEVIETETIIEHSIAETPSAADEIRKFKSLLDEGIITQEEFDTKKKELLNL